MLPTLNKLAPDTKVFFVSQETDPEVVAAALETAALGYVQKADVGEDLIAAIYSVVRGNKFLSRGLQHSKWPEQ
jgi:DNA-binding NarL/FixJ family response regulator